MGPSLVLRILSTTRAGSPDIAGRGTEAGNPQFHAVWLEGNGPGEHHVWYARDLVGDGSGWQVVGLLTNTGRPTDAAWPRVSADLLHAGPFGSTAVNVAFLDRMQGAVLYLRSTDSGSAFSATGSGPAGPPALINDPAVGDATGPLAFDTGGAGRPWHGLLWYEDQAPGPVLLTDAQFQTEPSTADPGWNEPDLLVEGAGPGIDNTLALSVHTLGPGGRTPMFLVSMDGFGGFADLFYRGGLLDLAATPSIDLDTFPFPAVRPTDPVASTKIQLTACSWDEVTGDCVGNRTAGRAARPAVDEADGNLFLAWVDDRSGGPEIWFKRTDRTAGCLTAGLTAACSSWDSSRITVEWSPIPECCACLDVEKMERYLVHYGTDPVGPYDNAASPLVVVDDGNLPDPVTLEIDGLALDTLYSVIVVPEDEARNLYPPDFDPFTDGDLPPPCNEESVTTPAYCRCLHRKVSPAQDTTGLFMARDADTDIAFTGTERTDPYGPCPFPPGERDPEPVLDLDSYVLVFYQMQGPDIRHLRVTKDIPAGTVRIHF